ncbi:hypothetical protein HanRHA438_Chr01g0025501 [Helianthus annuus]|nr:hypothetical protein HanIR_Chr01g0026811 [Helianthus annuus]KAJ0809955.1 hypothetical protein HanPI659440_Chr01g0021151 [Helianthus annuus]KAJ0948295.1 hypothetical protein HanRHA438_Chr01g0025501 [Helianthus annuus]
MIRPRRTDLNRSTNGLNHQTRITQPIPRPNRNQSHQTTKRFDNFSHGRPPLPTRPHTFSRNHRQLLPNHRILGRRDPRIKHTQQLPPPNQRDRPIHNRRRRMTNINRLPPTYNLQQQYPKTKHIRFGTQIIRGHVPRIKIPHCPGWGR